MNEYYIRDADSCIRYLDFPGNDIPILLIHGLGCAGSFDYPQVVTQQELAGHRRVLVDLLGAGYSDKPSDFEYSVSDHAKYLKGFVEDISLKTFLLFGHSLGGAVAIELAKLCADRIYGLILSEPNLDPSAEGSGSHQIADFPEKLFVEEGFHKVVEENRRNGNSLWAASLSNWIPAAAYRISKSAVQGGTPSWRKTFYELPVPKGFIFGERSLPDEDYDVMKQRGVHVETVEQAGHSMAWENPQGLAIAVSRCVEAFRTTF